jgi:hypothetical protein
MISYPAPAVEGRLYHVGVVVRDIDAAMTAYRSLLGVETFHRMDTHYEARHRDWTGTIANRNAFGRLGGLMVELVEPGLGRGPAHEFLDTRGEGLFHIGYATEHPDQRPGGVGPCFEVHSTRRSDGTYGIVYLDTLESLGFFVELVARSTADRLITLVDDE